MPSSRGWAPCDSKWCPCRFTASLPQPDRGEPAMRSLTPLAEISVPKPKPDRTYTMRCFDRQVTFRGVKAVLAAADFTKAGDRHAGLAVASETEREAARAVLSDLTLEHLLEH